MGGGASKQKLLDTESETAKLQSENEGLQTAVKETVQALRTLGGSVDEQSSDIRDAIRDAAAMKIQLSMVRNRSKNSQDRLREVEDVELQQRKALLDRTSINLATSTAELFETRKELAEVRLRSIDLETKLVNETESQKALELSLSELNTEHSVLQREYRGQKETLERLQMDLDFAKVNEMKASAAEEKARRVSQQALRDQQKAERETLDANAHGLSVEAELGEVRASRDAALARYDVVDAELRSVEKSAADWRWLGETAQNDLDTLRTERTKAASELEDLNPKVDRLKLELAESQKDLQLTQATKARLGAQLGPMHVELKEVQAELDLARSTVRDLEKVAQDRYEKASCSSREFRAVAQETAHWRQLANSTRRDLEGFMAKKQFEVRDRLALSEESKRKLDATTSSSSSQATAGKLMVADATRHVGAPARRSDPRAEAKQLEETLHLLTIQTTELTYAHRQGIAYLRSPLLFSQTAASCASTLTMGGILKPAS